LSTAVEVLCRFALLLAGPQSAAPHPTARVDALFAHLDRAIPESGFPNGSRRFLLTDQSADRNDGDERLRLWLPPSGSLLSEPLDAADAVRLTAAVGCEFHDSIWPPEGSDAPRPAGARMRHDFAIEWVPAAAGASVVALAACRVVFDPETAVDGRVRVDVDVEWPTAARGEGRIRFRVARVDGPPGDLSILPTLWGPRVVHAARDSAPPAIRPEPRLREEVVTDLLDPRFAPGRKGAERVELGTRSAGSGGAGNGAPAPAPATEAVTRPGVVVEAHFETGHGIELPNGGARPALAFAGRGEARFDLPADACANGARLVFEPGFFDWSGVPSDALADARARWRVELDGRELVAGDLAAPRRAVDRGWGAPVDVALVAKDGAASHELVLTVEVSDYSAPVDAVVASEPLADGGTREQRLRLERPWFGLARPRLVRARPVARAAATAAAPNVLWICVETFRADEVGFGAGVRATTPFLARLAPRALVFSQATSPAPWTLPSVASYFTGLHPFEHGARSELEDVLPDRLPKLAEVAANSAGARTFAAVTNDLIRRDAGFAAGFDVFAPFAYANAAAVRRLFLDWQSEEPSERFFAYLHWFEPHAPLNAPGWMRDAFVPPGLRDLPYIKEESAPKKAMRQTGDARNSGDALEYLRGRYRGEVRFVDLQVELLFAELARRGLLDRTLVIVTGDHGEEFGEHRWFGHGSQLYEESIHVPLLLHGPGVPAGRIDVPVESLLASRIAAAALGVAGFGSDALPAPEWPLSRDRLEEQWAGQPVVSTTEKLIDAQSPGWPADGDGFVARVTPRAGRVLRVGDKKSILARPVGRGRAPPAAGDALELFDLARDPGELAPERVAWDESAVGRFARFAAWLATERRLDAALPTLETAPDVREVLRRLGYTQGGTGDR
jgi:arylsulfatase A-like enzyme